MSSKQVVAIEKLQQSLLKRPAPTKKMADAWSEILKNAEQYARFEKIASKFKTFSWKIVGGDWILFTAPGVGEDQLACIHPEVLDRIEERKGKALTLKWVLDNIY